MLQGLLAFRSLNAKEYLIHQWQKLFNLTLS